MTTLTETSEDSKFRHLYPSEWREFCRDKGIEDIEENRNRFFIDENCPGFVNEIFCGSLAHLRGTPKPFNDLRTDLINEMVRTVHRISSLPEDDRRKRILKLTREVFDAGDLGH